MKTLQIILVSILLFVSMHVLGAHHEEQYTGFTQAGVPIEIVVREHKYVFLRTPKEYYTKRIGSPSARTNEGHGKEIARHLLHAELCTIAKAPMPCEVQYVALITRGHYFEIDVSQVRVNRVQITREQVEEYLRTLGQIRL